MSPLPDVYGPGNHRTFAVSSPEFEFRQLSAAPELLSADELFLDGVILPLDRLPNPTPPAPPTSSDDIPPPSASSLSASPSSSSKRWREIFRSPEKTATPPEQSIKLWPFFRSRSAGICGDTKNAAAKRVSSAPCSRSGSCRGSPNRIGGGVGVRRGGGVWRARRGGKKGDQEKLFNLRDFFARKLYIRE